MDFLNQREGGMAFYQVFLLSSFQSTVTVLYKYLRGYVSLKKYIRGWVSFTKEKSQGKAVEMTNSKDFDFADYADLCLDFIHEFGLWS